MTHRVLCYRNGDYDPSASTDPMTLEEAEAVARERVKAGYETFVVEVRAGKGEAVRVVKAFEG